jgi:hypothetical protein
MNAPTAPGLSPRETWLGSAPRGVLAAFAAFAAVYIAVFSALFARRIGEYFGEIAGAFEFARPWLERLSR